MDALAPPEAEAKRFAMELEFVQMLANPGYVQWLSQEGYLSNAPFLRYLDYLSYWREPQCARHLLYPAALTVLELLQKDAEFRAAAANPGFIGYFHQQIMSASTGNK